jgi:hypothetical protein
VQPIGLTLVAHARRRIVHDFVAADATAAERAMPYTPVGKAAGRLFDRMRAAGALAEAGEGRFWLDAERLDDFRVGTRRKLATLLAVIATGAAGLAVLGE